MVVPVIGTVKRTLAQIQEALNRGIAEKGITLWEDNGDGSYSPSKLLGIGGSANVEILAGENLSGIGYEAQPYFNRPANTTAYGSGDVVGPATAVGGAVLEFTNMGAVGKDIIITDVDLTVALAAVPSGMTSFRLHLYNATPPSALGDNTAWDLPASDITSYLGYIDMGTPVDVGSSLFVQTSGVNKKLRMGASTSLFGYLVTNGGYTPASATVYYPRLNAVGV